MLLVKRRYVTAKTGTILFQSIYRGHATRRVLATIKIQSQVRRRKHHVAFKRLKSATIALQCRQRKGMAKKVLDALKHEQKDIGKLKQNNEKLKSEMASLKAMLAAQAKSGAMKIESDKELEERELEIKRHMKRIKELEELLEEEKENVRKIEARLEDKETVISEQQEKISILNQQNQNLSLNPPSSPPRKSKLSSTLPPSSPVHMPVMPIVSQPKVATPPRATQQGNYVDDSKALAEAKAQVAMLEHALEEERAARREIDSEVIKLRAQANGVNLGEEELRALLPSDEDIKSSITLPAFDPTDMKIETQNTNDTIESDER